MLTERKAELLALEYRIRRTRAFFWIALVVSNLLTGALALLTKEVFEIASRPGVFQLFHLFIIAPSL
jgi:hypothetical protein